MQTEMLPDIVRRVDRRQPACRSALPQAAFLPRKNSAGLFGEGKSDDGKEEDASILAYAKDDDAVSADLHRRKACVSLSNEGTNRKGGSGFHAMGKSVRHHSNRY